MQFGVSPKTVRDIWNRRSWAPETRHLWIPGELPAAPRRRTQRRPNVDGSKSGGGEVSSSKQHDLGNGQNEAGTVRIEAEATASRCAAAPGMALRTSPFQSDTGRGYFSCPPHMPVPQIISQSHMIPRIQVFPALQGSIHAQGNGLVPSIRPQSATSHVSNHLQLPPMDSPLSPITGSSQHGRDCAQDGSTGAGLGREPTSESPPRPPAAAAAGVPPSAVAGPAASSAAAMKKHRTSCAQQASPALPKPEAGAGSTPVGGAFEPAHGVDSAEAAAAPEDAAGGLDPFHSDWPHW